MRVSTSSMTNMATNSMNEKYQVYLDIMNNNLDALFAALNG